MLSPSIVQLGKRRPTPIPNHPQPSCSFSELKKPLWPSASGLCTLKHLPYFSALIHENQRDQNKVLLFLDPTAILLPCLFFFSFSFLPFFWGGAKIHITKLNTHHLKVYNSTAFCTITVSCNHCLCPASNHVHRPKRKHCTFEG